MHLQKLHVLRLTLDNMREEHVSLIRNQIVFSFHALHTKKNVRSRQVICYDCTCILILRVWEDSM